MAPARAGVVRFRCYVPARKLEVLACHSSVTHALEVSREARSNASWSLDLPEGRHDVAVEYGYWLGKAVVRVDGRVVSRSRPLLAMSVDMGVDLPIEVAGHAVVVSVRPITTARVVVTGYRFGLSVDGAPALGTEPVPAVRPGSNWLGRGWTSDGRRWIETLSWATTGGAIIGLGQRGENPVAILYLGAPAACSFITRRTTLSTHQMGLACVAIVVLWTLAIAALGTLVR